MIAWTWGDVVKVVAGMGVAFNWGMWWAKVWAWTAPTDRKWEQVQGMSTVPMTWDDGWWYGE